MAELGPPGVKSTRAWVGQDQRNMVNTLVHKGRWIGARTWLATVRSGSARRNSPASERSRSARLRPGSERAYARAQGQRDARARLNRTAEDSPRRGRGAGGGGAPVVRCSGT